MKYFAPALLLLASSPLFSADSPNVVIVDICSARADHFGIYGYGRPTTPGIDALAKDSVVFDRAMAQSSWCLPNYASLFTGHTPEVHGQYTNVPFRPLPDFETTLAERLKGGGYDTAAFAGGVYLLPIWGLDRGFDHYVDYFSTSTATPARFKETMPDALQWIGTPRKRPFFAYVSVDDLHAPYQSEDPERFDKGYQGIVHDTETVNIRFFRAYNGEPLETNNPLAEKLRIFRSDPRNLRHMIAHYDASLRSVDSEVDEFVRQLKSSGMWDRTVVIVTADHGELLGEHGLLGHTEGLYEPIVHVPLLIHVPGGAGKRISKLVERIDVTPTVLDLAGQDPRGNELQGRSLVPLLRGSNVPWRQYAFASSKRNMATVTDFLIDERVVRDARWKLHWYLHKNRFELYDLDKDPLETRDVGAQNPAVVQRLTLELLKQIELSRPHAPGLPSGKNNAQQIETLAHPPSD